MHHNLIMGFLKGHNKIAMPKTDSIDSNKSIAFDCVENICAKQMNTNAAKNKPMSKIAKKSSSKIQSLLCQSSGKVKQSASMLNLQDSDGFSLPRSLSIHDNKVSLSKLDLDSTTNKVRGSKLLSKIFMPEASALTKSQGQLLKGDSSKQSTKLKLKLSTIDPINQISESYHNPDHLISYLSKNNDHYTEPITLEERISASKASYLMNKIREKELSDDANVATYSINIGSQKSENRTTNLNEHLNSFTTGYQPKPDFFHKVLQTYGAQMASLFNPTTPNCNSSASIIHNLSHNMDLHSDISHKFGAMAAELKIQVTEVDHDNKSLSKKLHSLQAECENLLELETKLKASNSKLQDENTKYTQAATTHKYLILENNHLQNQIHDLKKQLSMKESKMIGLKRVLEKLNVEKTQVSKEREESLLQASHSTSKLKEINEICHKLELLKDEEFQKRFFFDRLQKIQGDCLVMLKIYATTNNSVLSFMGYNRIAINMETIKPSKSNGFAKSFCKPKICSLDRIFRPKEPIKEVFEEVKTFIECVMDGFNACVIAFGQTGTGKTHTMFGTLEETGLIEYIIAEILTKAEETTSWTYRLQASVLEVWQNNIQDLLSSSTVVTVIDDGKKMRLRDITEKLISNMHDIIDLVNTCREQRSTYESSKSATASRNHLLVIVRIEGTGLLNGTVTRGVLMFCDMTGFEDIDDLDGAERQVAKTASKYNHEAMVLGQVIIALKTKAKNIPYEKCRLTQLLKPCLTNGAKRCLLLHSFCGAQYLPSILNTVNFGMSAMTKDDSIEKNQRNRTKLVIHTNSEL